MNGFGHQLEIYFLELPRLQKTWPNAVTNMERQYYLFQKLSIFAKVSDDASEFEAIFQTDRTDQLSEEQNKLSNTTSLCLPNTKNGRSVSITKRSLE